MYKEKNKLFNIRLKTTIITFLIIASLLSMIPQSIMATSHTQRLSKSTDLTCGETITWYFNNNSFKKGEDYLVKIWDGNTYQDLKVSNREVDDYGNLEIQFNVPGWSELGKNPIGIWNISLWQDATTDVIASWSNTSISITNLYYLKFFYKGEEIDHLLYNSSYAQSDFTVKIYNWTGTKLELQDNTGDEDFTGKIWRYVGGSYSIEESSENINDGSWEVGFQINEKDVDIPNYEIHYWFHITNKNNPALSSNTSFPVLLNMTSNYPSNAEWGDTVDIYGYILDGNGDGIAGYDFRVYAPNNAGDYTRVYFDDTDFSGYYSASVATGSGEEACAGTWYVGTYNPDDTEPRANITDKKPYIPGFIPYASFTVSERDDATVGIENSDDFITGFNQTINISVKNESWMDNFEYQNMFIHVTGIKGYNATTGWEYDENDIVQVAMGASWVSTNEKYAYYRFTYHFNQTGTGSILVSYEKNLTAIIDDETTNPISGFYTAKYGNDDLRPNITGSKSFSVIAADSMNLVIDGAMVDSVVVNENPGACTQNQWINGSDMFTLNIYGDSSADRMNATIEVTGCGLDFKIKENDPTDAKELVGWSWGRYMIRIAPKTAGTLTITATNDTSGESVIQDYTVTGLTGSVTTSVGDDLKITVGTPETITVDVTNGQYSEVTLTYFDTEWTKTNSAAKVINNTDGDNTEGNGLNGVFTFIPDEDDIDTLGYIVVAAKAGGSNYMYDIIEIEPIYDLEIELVKPSLVNATPILTVGLEQDLAFRLLDADGNDVEDDDPSATVKLIDADHDEDNPLMEWSSDLTGDWAIDQSGDEWQIDDMMPWWKGQIVITGQNNTDGLAHAGNLTLDVDYATFTFEPTAATAGIDIENLTVTVTGVDANGDPLPDGTTIYFWCNDSVDAAVCVNPSNANAVDFKDADTSIELDEDGMGEFELDKVGDNKTKINATFGGYNPSNGNRTLGEFNIYFPVFELTPDTIYINMANTVTVIAKDNEGEPIEGINLTFWGAAIAAQPHPAKTDTDGKAIFSIEPLSSGVLNVTIARNVRYVGGMLAWNNAVITDSIVTVTAIDQMKVSLSKSPIYEGQTLTVTVTSGTNPLEGVAVGFGDTTVQTDASGQATFTAPDPGVESAVYMIIAEKTGYTTVEKSITVIKIWDITIIAPSKAPGMGEEFTVTILAKGAPLAGATVEFEGKTYTSGADGKLTITAPDRKGKYNITASYEDFTSATIPISIKKGWIIPGFELLLFLIGIGFVALLLLHRRKLKI